MQIGDGKNDGIFKIRKGEDLQRAILSELGLTVEQYKNIQESVWTQIFNEVNNNLQVNNYSVYEGQVIKFSQKIWAKITNIVNNALKINIKTDFEDPIQDDQDNDADNVIKSIHEAICKRKLGLIPTTGKLEDCINLINADNASYIVQCYQKKYGESIFSAIIKEYGLDIDKRINYIKHIKNCFIEGFVREGIYCDDISSEFDTELRYQKRKLGFADAEFLNILVDQLERRYEGHYNTSENPNQANGEIDSDFMQGITGDCWLVATIKSISNNPKVKKKLEDLVSVDKFGNITVTLKGINRTYIFTAEETEGATELSKGEMDVRAIEMAVNKYYHEQKTHKFYGGLDINEGGFEYEALKILFGKYGESYDREQYGDAYISFNRDSREVGTDSFDAILKKIKTGNYICNAAFDNSPSSITIKNENNLNSENDIEIYPYHSYSVVNADLKYIYLVNPWDTSQVFKITHDDFVKIFNSINLLDVSEVGD